MENRFGIKDFFLFLLIAALIGVVFLAMEQYDRQWSMIQQTNNLLNQQTNDLSQIRRLLERGAFTSSTTNPSPGFTAGFERVLKSQSASDFAQGDDLVDTLMVVPEKLTPLVSGDVASAIVQSYIQDSLCNRDPNTLEWIPQLASSWKVSSDQLTIDFELRRGITFSDGSPFTADDVVFTFDFMRDERIEAPRVRAYLDKLGSVKKIDDYHVRFVFTEPYFKSFETVAGSGIMPKSFYSKFSPEEFNNSTGLLMGSGPYRLADPQSWRPTPGAPVVVVRNERYWGPTPSFNRLIWKVIENPSARTTAFQNGDTDIFGGMAGGPTPDQYDQMCADTELTARTKHWSLTVPSEGFIYIGWNQKQGKDGKPSVFADARVRRAMTMLTDRDRIVKDIMRGYASVISGPFSPLTPQADPSIKPWPYDPAVAQKLLADAGFTRQGDQLLAPDGKPVEFKIMYNSSNEIRSRIASYLHDAYAQAGILAEPEPIEWSVMLKRLDNRQFDVYLGGWSGDIEFDAYQIFDSSQIVGTGDNFIQYSDPEADKLIRKARAIVDDAQRMPVWHEVDQVFHRDEPYTCLFIEKDLDFLDSRMHGVDVTKLGLNSTLEWYVPRDLQKYHD
jgi:peptide/nickel transport system substrate-binding protein